MKPKKKKFDKLKVLKKISRETNKIAGRGGAHINKSEKRSYKKSTADYLLDLEEDEESISSIRCKLCKEFAPIETAHVHEGEWIGHNCCWAEHLKVVE